VPEGCIGAISTEINIEQVFDPRSGREYGVTNWCSPSETPSPPGSGIGTRDGRHPPPTADRDEESDMAEALTGKRLQILEFIGDSLR